MNKPKRHTFTIKNDEHHRLTCTIQSPDKYLNKFCVTFTSHVYDTYTKRHLDPVVSTIYLSDQEMALVGTYLSAVACGRAILPRITD